MERLLHYVWKHRLFPLGGLTTTDGRHLEVIDPGLPNRNAGPDFFNAKLKIDGLLWVGNVEIHDRAADWYQHKHHTDTAYDNVVLHVCRCIDRDIETHDGRQVPQLQLDVPPHVEANYRQLLATDHYPPCYAIVPQLPRLVLHAWMNALGTERLEQKTRALQARLERCEHSWETAYFVTLARNFGFGINGDAFEQWALALPLRCVDHHRDNILQTEAFFMGQAGLLSAESLPEKHREQALADPFYQDLSREYNFLKHKFNLAPIDHRQWRFLRLRPQNFPHIRISQLAQLYHRRQAGFRQIMEAKTLADLRQALSTQPTPYWQTHYAFASESRHSEKRLSAASTDVIIVNTVVPLLFAYGQYKRDEHLTDRAFLLLEQLKPEQNHITRMWKECGLEAETAADSQALLQLKNQYCDRKDCLRCRIGHEYLRKNR